MTRRQALFRETTVSHGILKRYVANGELCLGIFGRPVRFHAPVYGRLIRLGDLRRLHATL
jgi:hypothetical protein